MNEIASATNAKPFAGFEPFEQMFHVSLKDDVLKRLTGEEGHEPFAGIDALLQELESAGKSIPANAAAWDRFLRHIREQATDTPLRRSA